MVEYRVLNGQRTADLADGTTIRRRSGRNAVRPEKAGDDFDIILGANGTATASSRSRRSERRFIRRGIMDERAVLEPDRRKRVNCAAVEILVSCAIPTASVSVLERDILKRDLAEIRGDEENSSAGIRLCNPVPAAVDDDTVTVDRQGLVNDKGGVGLGGIDTDNGDRLPFERDVERDRIAVFRLGERRTEEPGAASGNVSADEVTVIVFEKPIRAAAHAVAKTNSFFMSAILFSAGRGFTPAVLVE